MAKRAIVLLADGFEEVEAITPIDYLRRAGVEVTTVSISGSRTVTGSHGIQITADTMLADIAPQAAASQSGSAPSADASSLSDSNRLPDASGLPDVSGLPDAVLLPGGGVGADNLAASVAVGALIAAQLGSGKIVAAICASPAVVLAPLGVLKGRRFTCYPGLEGKVNGTKSTGAQWSEETVVIDGNVVTSRGAGTAAAWAIALIGELAGQGEAAKVAKSVLL
ncbi:DJ-1 family protein [Spirochaetia bacterium]|nr:DJ-1 family protein [Spirochaetia bacterium]